MAGGVQLCLDVAYPGFQLSVDLPLPGSGITALFGPSGSGKTTCLRAIAGLERAPHGYVSVNGAVWQDEARGVFQPTHRRELAYVFQEASLFAHLNVRRNLEYGFRRVRHGTGPANFAGVVELLGIDTLLHRRPERLSGGERQRVAIARALLTNPRLMLFDEPLAALDAARKDEILPYLERLHEELKIPSIYVSHNTDEVARLADHLVILDQGKVVASGPLQATLARVDFPRPLLDRAGVVIEATVTGYDEADHLAQLDFPGGSLLVPSTGQPLGRRVRCRIEARDVSLTLGRHDDTSVLNLLPGTITAVTEAPHPAHCLVQFDAGGTLLLAQVTRRSREALQLAPGKPVWAQVKAVALVG